MMTTSDGQDERKIDVHLISSFGRYQIQSIRSNIWGYLGQISSRQKPV